MNSVEVTRYMYQKGYISKEAALKILKHRNELVKEAVVQCTNEIFGFKKTAGWFLQNFGKGEAKGKLPLPEKGPKALAIGKTFKNILPLLGLASLVALGTTAAKVGLGAVSNIRTRGNIDESYKKMFREFPELSENKPQATKYFNMMARFAPALASNPLIAGTWVKGTMDANVVAPQSIQQLMEAQNEWEKIQTTKSPFSAFSQEMPPTKSIFEKAIMADSVISE